MFKELPIIGSSLNQNLAPISSPSRRLIADPYEPDEEGHVWRYIRGIGWRKFSPEGAHVKDWWDYRKTLPRHWGPR